MKIRKVFVTCAFLGLVLTATSAQADDAAESSPSICRTVKAGDNPWNLVRRLGGIVDRTMIARVLPQFMAYNKITNPHRLMPGYRVCFSEDMMPAVSVMVSESASQVVTNRVPEPALMPIVPFSQPLAWPVSSAGAAISQVFDLERDHPAIDLAAPANTLLRASGEGVVVRVFEDEFNHTRCGNEIEIRYARHAVVYCHLATINVKEGDHVRLSTIFGTVGKTGNATGPHVHIIVADRLSGRAVDPLMVFDSAQAPRLWKKANERRQALLATVSQPKRPAFAIATAAGPIFINIMQP